MIRDIFCHSEHYLKTLTPLLAWILEGLSHVLHSHSIFSDCDQQTHLFSSSDRADSVIAQQPWGLLFWFQTRKSPNVKNFLRLQLTASFGFPLFPTSCVWSGLETEVLKNYTYVLFIEHWYCAWSLTTQWNTAKNYYFYGISSPTRKINYWKFHKNTLFLQDFQASSEDQRWSGSLDETQLNILILAS